MPEGKLNFDETVFFASSFWLFSTLADRERAARDKMKVGKKLGRKDQSGTAGHWGSFNQVILVVLSFCRSFFGLFVILSFCLLVMVVASSSHLLISFSHRSQTHSECCPDSQDHPLISGRWWTLWKLSVQFHGDDEDLNDVGFCFASSVGGKCPPKCMNVRRNSE